MMDARQRSRIDKQLPEYYTDYLLTKADMLVTAVRSRQYVMHYLNLHDPRLTNAMI
jgi:hypothetical protein